MHNTHNYILIQFMLATSFINNHRSRNEFKVGGADSLKLT